MLCLYAMYFVLSACCQVSIRRIMVGFALINSGIWMDANLPFAIFFLALSFGIGWGETRQPETCNRQ